MSRLLGATKAKREEEFDDSMLHHVAKRVRLDTGGDRNQHVLSSSELTAAAIHVMGPRPAFDGISKFNRLKPPVFKSLGEWFVAPPLEKKSTNIANVNKK